ncbi:MAG: hypothetical protein WCF61_07485 [Terriglobales bacterium]
MHRRISRDIVGKNAVLLRSSIVRKTAGILGRTTWLALCLTALIYAYKGYQGSSDWKLEEGLAFEMMALSFPASLLAVAKVATAHRVRIRAISRDCVKRAFPDSRNKDGIALAVASRLPTLSLYIPPTRKPRKPEHYRMSVFAAAAIGLSHFDSHGFQPVAELNPFVGPSVA